MTIYVFTGPTLSSQEAHNELDAVYLPPVSQGDVYRAMQKQPQAIGIIDGYFERVPAVWHKEILWAMVQGIPVYGSASMGALRAAELDLFGMKGVGTIFEGYRDGILEDDDEVAVVHGSAETGYLIGSEAMVNIRYTLEAAELADIIGPTTHKTLVCIAKNLFYPERNYSLILQLAGEQGLPIDQLEALNAWLPYGQVNQKRQDALAMLRVMREQLSSNSQPKGALYTFEYTEMWDRASRFAGAFHVDSKAHADTVLTDSFLNELRLEGHKYNQVHQGTMLRFFALQEARRQGIVITSRTLQETAERFRHERGLRESKDFQLWLEEHDLSHDQFVRLMEDEAKLHWMETLAEPEVASLLSDYLRVTGEYVRLMTRILDKQHLLEAHGLQNLSLMDVGLTEEELLHWYFEQHLDRSFETDIAHYARSIGFQDENTFKRAVLDEYCYSAVLSRRL